MNREELEKYILDTYGVKPEYLWSRYPTFAVFRHECNKKWFAVIMTIDKRRLGINEEGQIDVVNLKCEPNFTVSAFGEQGIYPAYHMNKEHWITVALDGSVSTMDVQFLLALSHKLTDKKMKKTISSR